MKTIENEQSSMTAEGTGNGMSMEEELNTLRNVVKEQDEAIRKYLANERELVSTIKRINHKLRCEVIKNDSLKSLINALKLQMQSDEDKHLTESIVAESYEHSKSDAD